MEGSTHSETHSCSVCSAVANLVCKACKGAPDGSEGVLGVYYCGSTCQKVGWGEHKTFCKAAKERRAVYRAGEIARQLHYTFNRNSWMWPIARAEKTDDTWWVNDGEPTTSKSAVIPFPSAMFPDIKDQRAMLSFNSCNGAVAFLHQLLNDMLKGQSFPHTSHCMQDH